MSSALLNLAFRQPRQNVPPVAVVDDFEPLAYQYQQKTQQSQHDLNVSKALFFDRLQKRQTERKRYYALHREKINSRVVEKYHTNDEYKKYKIEYTKKYYAKNPRRCYEWQLKWRKNNPDRVKAHRKKIYDKSKQDMEKFKLTQRLKRERVRAKKIAAIGYDEFRRLENARSKLARERKIERIGFEEYRRIENERAQKLRAKKREKKDV